MTPRLPSEIQEQKQVFYTTDNQTVLGPIQADELMRQVLDGTLPRDTKVCPEGTEEWSDAMNCRSISAKLREELALRELNDGSASNFISDSIKIGAVIVMIYYLIRLGMTL